MAKSGVDNKQVRRCLLNLSSVKADSPFAKIGSEYAKNLSIHTLKKAFPDTKEKDLTQAEGHLKDITGR